MKALFALTAAFLASSVIAEEGDDTLRYFLSKSDIVVIGKVATDPEVDVSEDGVAKCRFGVSVTESLKGDNADDYINVTVAHSASNADDKLPWLNKKSKVLLFLRNAGDQERPNWTGADVWFSVQPHSGRMASSLKRLVAETQTERLPLMEGIVLSEKNGIAELSLGADDGIKAGHVLFWYRDDIGLGQMVVLSTTGDKSSAKFTVAPQTGIVEAGPVTPKKNDRVAARAK